ncbi:MAG: DUF72 domain-containing protein [Candidatus Binatia bacterium]
MSRKFAEPFAIRVGCSGWIYPHWRERFYPKELSQKEWFRHYAQTFDTVEINNSFYHLPSEKAVAQWKEQAPPGFVYAVKVNRFITHMKKLKEPQEPLRRFISRMRGLGEHLGPLLYQLPPHWNCNPERFSAFLDALPPELMHVFEFRHQSWINDQIFAALEAHGASLCVHDMIGIEIPRVAIGPVTYVRFHGTLPKYAGGYSDTVLSSWARWLQEQATAGQAAFAYFNNDAEAQAVFDAQKLRRQIGQLT